MTISIDTDSPSATGPVGPHTLHYLEMIERVGGQKDHGYHYHHLMVVFEISGPFDGQKFKSAALQLSALNPALRTTFKKVGDCWSQQIGAHPDSRFYECRKMESNGRDWRKVAHDAIQAENDVPFSLTGEPLSKIILLEFTDAKVVFGKFHHIVCDGWGILVAMNQLLGLYMAQLAGTAASIPELSPAQYLSFATEELTALQSRETKDTAAWWQSLLGEHGFLKKPLPTRPPGFLNIVAGLLTPEQNQNLASAAKQSELHISYFAHAAFLKALRHHVGGDDLLITYVKANRNATNSAVVGNFADWIPVRHRLNLDLPLLELARQAQADVAASKERYLPYWYIVQQICPEQYFNDFGLTPYSFDFVPAFEPKIDFGAGVSFNLLHELQVFPVRLTATDIFCRATQYRDPASNELHLSIDLIYHSGFLSADQVKAVSQGMIAELTHVAA
jgi:hypothetical protein